MKPEEQSKESGSASDKTDGGELKDKDLDGVTGGALNAYLPTEGAAVDSFRKRPGDLGNITDGTSNTKL